MRNDDLIQITPAVPQYWKTVDELSRPRRAGHEFPGGLPEPDSSPVDSKNTRRDFLARMGFTLSAASLAACRAPVQHAVPLLEGSDRLVPGVPVFYATTCGGCPSACGLVVKQRDGRPIKVEGNERSTLSGGGTCALGQSTVLSLYDGERLRGPRWNGQQTDWERIDQQIRAALEHARRGKVVLISHTVHSPSTLAIIQSWRERCPSFQHVMYDPVSASALRAAVGESYGFPSIPHYSFDRARVIVGIDADFLGTWISPVEFTRQYVAARKPDPHSALHVQFESGVSLTGANADVRVPVAPSELGAIAAGLLRRIAEKSGVHDIPAPTGPESNSVALSATADELWKRRGESLVVSGVQDQSVQIAVNAINDLLGNVGRTLDLARPSLQRAGDDAALANLVDEMERGEIHGLFFYGANPVYDYPDSRRFAAALRKVELSVSFSDRLEETSSLVHAVCPDHHFLEAWGDAEPVRDHFGLSQPLIAPLFNTRAAQDSLLRWIGEDSSYYDYLREYWRTHIYARQRGNEAFRVFWDRTLQDGAFDVEQTATPAQPRFRNSWKAATRSLAPRGSDGYELHLYESIALRSGEQANNPWLQELPDPITKVTWGNYAAVAPALARKLNMAEGDVVSLTAAGGTLEVPVFIQPGQHERTISVALGYGRENGGKVARRVGANSYPIASIQAGFRRYSAPNLDVKKTGRREAVAGTQGHFTLEGHPIILETTLEELHQPQRENEADRTNTNLWPDQPHGQHSWGMLIDMNACTGCSACVVACQAENNVPVIGKDQVRRERLMHWIRIDHYYSGAEDHPANIFQPMMCQHCGHAPCETVCPVLATTTSSEGLNQQVYNRCIGTRYCLNNCPYKVRRFNFFNYAGNSAFDYHMNNPLGRMVLNPDVVVRSRGVMEKCSMCVQRIQLGKNIALQGKRDMVDGEVQTACQQACPAQAIVFGDLADPNSRVSKLRKDPRYYQVLEEVGTRPNVGYLKKVRSDSRITG